MGFNLETVVTVITILTGGIALYRQYRQDGRSTLKEDYERTHQEREEYRKRCDEQETELDRLQKENGCLKLDVAMLRSDRDALKSERDTLQRSLTAATELIHRLQAEIAQLGNGATSQPNGEAQ